MARRRGTLTPRDLVYVMARSASGRPCLMHQLVPGSASFTLCGRDMSLWSRAFLTAAQARPIIDLMYCKRCGKIADLNAAA